MSPLVDRWIPVPVQSVALLRRASLQAAWRNPEDSCETAAGCPILASRMIYKFGQFELDLATVELRVGGKTLDVEPQVFALLALLVANSERLVSKDEIIEKVWDGRVVTDAAVASRVKSARQALGDDGKSQRFIKTIHRRRYRFVGKARAFGSAIAVPVFPASRSAARRAGRGAVETGADLVGFQQRSRLIVIDGERPEAGRRYRPHAPDSPKSL